MKPETGVSTKLQAVLWLKDGYSGAAIDDAAVVFDLDKLRCEPLRKAGGFYVFTNLLGTLPRQLHISCPGFFDAEVTIQTISLPLTRPLAELIVELELEPNPSYRYPLGTTLVCGRVTSAGVPLADAEVFALFSDSRGTWQWCRTLTYGLGRESDRCRGHYALALPATTPNSGIDLRFAKDGHVSHFDRVAPTRSMTTVIDADLQLAYA